jgi:hypothetical protein
LNRARARCRRGAHGGQIGPIGRRLHARIGHRVPKNTLATRDEA